MKIGDAPRIAQVVRTTRVRPAGATDGAAASEAVGGVGQTADTMSIMGVPEPELTPRVRDALMRLMAEVDALRRDLNRTRARLADLERLADQDTLAPIANRRAFVRELSKAMSFSERYGGGASLVFFDLNGLKEINDKFGHAAGDKALITVANLLMDNVRESDVVGRLGGDEFGVILVQSTTESAREKAESLAQAINNERFDWEGTRVPLEVAFGLHNFEPGDDATKALAAADRAMYQRKLEMKNGG